MDSMRNLRTVLPSATARRHTTQPTEQLLQAFKQAAMSVTTLYKTAASEQEQSYKEGYQSALEELLKFLDNENLGVQDGEGWRIRQWATERFQGVDGSANPGSDSEDDADDDKRARSSSPLVQKKQTGELMSQPVQSKTAGPPTAIRPGSAPPVIARPVTPDSEPKHLPTTFTLPTADFEFRSSHQMPPARDVDMESPESQNGNAGAQNNGHTFQVNLIPRPTRSSSRRGHPTPRANRTRGSGTSLGPGAGQKRSAIDMFWDMSGFNDKDGSPTGGGKRGRFG